MNSADGVSTKDKPQAREPAPRVAPLEVHASAPALGWYSDTVHFGEIWERPILDKRQRSIVTVAALIARSHYAQLTGHFNRALKHGLTPTEVVEVVTHLAFYAGWPCAISAVRVMQEVFNSHQILAETVNQSLSRVGLAAEPSDADPDGLAPRCAALDEYTDRLVDGDLWKRTELLPKCRSLATIACLVAQGEVEMLRKEAVRGMQNGLSADELYEAGLHLAFYVGWAKAERAVSVFRRAAIS
jgi:4-carboxymuconolactone decarboxylase